MICPAIANPASCKIYAFTHLLHALNMSAMEIHHELCMVYGQNVVSGRIVRKWCRKFKDDQTKVYDDEQSGWPSVMSDDFVQSVDQNICEK
jgi:hypothetical protein